MTNLALFNLAESELRTLRAKLKHSRHHIRLLVSEDQFSSYFESNRAFKDAVDDFFDLDTEEIAALYYLGYPIRGTLFFDHELLTRTIQIIPEFLLSLLSMGNSILFTIYQYQTEAANLDVEIKPENVRSISENVFFIWKQIGEIETSNLSEKQKLVQLSNVESVLNFGEVRYDFLGCFQMNVVSQLFYLSLRGISHHGTSASVPFEELNKRRILEEVVGYLAMPLVFADEAINIEDDLSSVFENITRRLTESGFITNVKSALQQAIEYPSIADSIHSSQQLQESEYVFQRIGDVWNIKYENEKTQMSHLNGLYYIHQLLISIGEHIRADVLASPAEHSMETPGGLMVDKDEIKQDYDTPDDVSHKLAPNYSEINETRVAYKSAMDVLRDELQELDKDTPLYKAKLDELVKIRKAYSGNYDKHGEERRQKTDEQARQSVQKAIKHVLDKLEHETPLLHAHLSRNITTGTECTYSPPEEKTLGWLL